MSGPNTPHILVVEDDREISTLIARYLRGNDCRVTLAGDGQDMDRALAESRIDLIVLDLMLPGEDGLSLCRRLRVTSQIPILILTAKSEDVDRILGLELGADDYLPKPFEPRELVARLQTILRRQRVAPAPVQAARRVFQDLVIDLEAREVLRQGQPVELTGTEFELLALLAAEPGKVFSRDDILNRLRGHEADLYTRAVDIVVSRLRKKLEPLDCIKTLRNAGYTLAVGKAAP